RLLIGLIEALLGIHRAHLLAVLVNVKHSHLAAVVWVVVLRVVLADERVRPDVHLVVKSELLFVGLVEGRSRKTDADHNKTVMDDVAAVTSRVAPRKLRNRRGPA